MHHDPGTTRPVVAARRPTARLVLEYLVLQGHTRAAQAYARDIAPIAPAPRLAPADVERMRVRQHILRLVRHGHIEEARRLCDEAFPAVLADTPCAEEAPVQVVEAPAPDAAAWALQRPREPAVLRLHMDMQLYLEGVRAMLSTRNEALADTALVQMQAVSQRIAALPASLQPTYRSIAHELAGLLACRTWLDIPSHRSPLLDRARRSVLAAQLNYAILAAQGTTPEPLLMRAAQHATLAWESLHTRRITLPLDHPATAFLRARRFQVPSRSQRDTTLLPRFQLAELARDHSPLRAAMLASSRPS
ncbi:hypothetical protein MCAP1_003410 [Malassezia caprae]|uniref:LisH domain-containing protein n=1 Tax=Malassezia caprae TaxID=1381934 RepID=A0AAF0EEQ8_9BASI|nr:hypothetical protein MCAP1_003410 [Malassezia caprae]